MKEVWALGEEMAKSIDTKIEFFDAVHMGGFPKLGVPFWGFL